MLCMGVSCISQGKAEFRSTGIKEACYMEMNAYCTENKRFKDGKNWTKKIAAMIITPSMSVIMYHTQ